MTERIEVRSVAGRRAAKMVVAAAATVGLSLAGAGAAHASTLDWTSGSLSITPASSGFDLGDGSWVTLDNGGTFFNNPDAPDGIHTPIDSSGANGIELGTTTSGGAFNQTDTLFNGSPFDAALVSAGKLEFDTTTLGGDGFFPLLDNANSDLTGLRILYPANQNPHGVYNIGGSSTTGTAPDGTVYVDPLEGGEDGSDNYWLQWATTISSTDEFNDFTATFHLEGTFTP